MPNQNAIVIVLRITVVTQCLGNAQWFLQVGETPLFSLMWGQPDVGGCGWSETIALAVQQVIGWYALVAAILILVRPYEWKKTPRRLCRKLIHSSCGWILGPLVLLQMSIAVAMCRMQLGFQPAPDWLAPQFAALFPLATHSARIAAPLVLWMFDPRAVPSTRIVESQSTPLSNQHRTTDSISPQRANLGIAIVRTAVAITFLAHGIEAISHHPAFMDLIIVSARKWLGWNLPEQTAEQFLTSIGIIDFVLATLCLVRNWPAVAWYMAFWGMATAASRVVAGGWEFHGHEFATRAPHGGLPLVLALYWMQQKLSPTNLRKIPP